MLKQLHKSGLKSEHCYAAAMISIGVAMASWFMAKRPGRSNIGRSDGWGIFIGEWAPTFFAMGNGLRTFEKK